MKKIKLIIAGIFLMTLSIGLQAQVPDPPDGHGETEDQEPGGNAPISGGVFILLGLGAAYGAKKVYGLKKKSV